MKHLKHALASLSLICFGLVSCNEDKKEAVETKEEPSFQVNVDKFADLQVLRYDVPGFNKLNLKQKTFVYHLSEAALAGRDIIYDQNFKHNLRIRKALEEIYTKYNGDKESEAFKSFEIYLKRFWFSNGIHHHYAETKLVPNFTQEDLTALINNTKDAEWPVMEEQSKEDFAAWLSKLILDPTVATKRVNKSKGVDKVKASAGNFYEGVGEEEVKEFYNNMENNPNEPLSLGLNSKLVKEDGKLVEKKWMIGGMYNDAIVKMVEHLEAALPFAGDDAQKKSLSLLIKYYKNGSLKTWDDYNVAWVKDVEASIDLIHGFIEVYHDPIGMRATYESCVQVEDPEASERMSTVSQNAQYFEDNSSIADQFKKEKVKGITYKVIDVAMEAGALAPSTAIGINLPNANWIRTNHGSKSVSLGNILAAYDKANAGGLTAEFCYTDEEANRAKDYGTLAGKMHTALHEVIGHASGQLNPGVGETKETLKNYAPQRTGISVVRL